MEDYEKTWNDYWRNIIYSKDSYTGLTGLDFEKLKKELHNYKLLKDKLNIKGGE